jgi:hypothetical protein
VNGCADVSGVPRNLIETFSQRRAEILDVMEARAEHSPKAAQIAALDTRKAKYGVDAHALRADWADRAAEVGFGVEKVDELVGRGVRREPQVWSVSALFDDLASATGVTERASTFVHRDVLRAIAERLPDGGDIAAIESLADVFLNDDRLVALGTNRQPRWTTRELLATEAALIERARSLQHSNIGVASPAAVERALAERPSISGEQSLMVRWLTASGSGIDPAVGAAGTGKIFTLDAARAAWEASGFEVLGAALAARAAAELRAGSAIPSTTIARLLGQLGSGRLTLTDRTIVVVDEAGMVGTRTLDAISRHTAVAGAKLVLVGDTAQLPEIDAGGSFRALTEQLPAARLVENRRQVQNWERQALDQLRNGGIGDAVIAYDGQGRIIVGDNADALRQELVEDWIGSHLAGEDAVMIASHRADVRDLNGRARAYLDAAGQLGTRRVDIGGREFAVGDRVLATRANHYDLDILNGDLGTITALSVDGITFHSERAGTERTMPTAAIADGHLDHGYARTNYKTQGATTDRAFILGDDGDLDHQAAYTALSRGRHDNRLYVLQPDPDTQQLLDLGDPGPGREEVLAHVEQELSRDRSQERASEHLSPYAADLLAALPAPEGRSIGSSAADLLAALPEPDHKRRFGSLREELLGQLPEPDVGDEGEIAAQLERVHRPQSGVDDDLGLGL